MGVEVEALENGVTTQRSQKDLDVLHSTVASPDLTTFTRLDELGVM